MRGGRILWGQIIVVFTIVLVMVWTSTQWVAFRLGFQPQLGNPWFDVAGWPVYYPPAFFWWWFSYDAYAPAIFTEGAFIATSGALFAIAAAFFMSIIRAREARNVATYGSARWAEDKEIHAAGLLGPDGVVLGRHSKDYLRHDGPEHVLCFAPTRSGKGVGLVVPTLLTWPGSCIVHDIKGENWNLTAGFRSHHGRVLLFDPTNVHSAAYNPLLEVRQGEWEVRDVQNIADILVDPEGQSRQAQPLGKDQPFATGRRDPACSLCGEGQDAGRRRELPVRSAPSGRGDLARDDGHAASRRSRVCIPSSRRRHASC
jgi:type IV secretion system protein VirD4